MDGIRPALIIAVVRLLINTPWVILGGIAFFYRLRVKKGVLILCITAIAMADFSSNIVLRVFCYGPAYHRLDDIRSLLYYVLILLFFALCFRFKAAQLLYVFLLLHAVSTMCNQAAFVAARLMYPEGTTISIVAAPWYAALMVGFVLLAFYPLLRFCRQNLNAAFDRLDVQALWRLCIMPVLFFVVFQLSLSVMRLYILDLTVAALTLMIFLAGILSYVTNVRLLLAGAETADAVQLAERLRSVDNQLALQTEMLAEASAHERELKQIRHDMRHHFAVLKTVLNEDGKERALSYLQEYIEQVEDSVKPPICQNTVADAVCRRYVALAGKQDIDLDITANIPMEPGVADGDLAVLLSNLWENALEACGRQIDGERSIRLRAQATGNSLMLSMTNSFDGVIRAKAGKDGEPVLLSLKRDGKEEGIGLASIRTIVGRYQGLCEFTYDAESFHVKVLLYVR